MDAPAEHHHYERRPRLGKRLDQFLLHACEIEVGRVVTLPDCGRAQETAPTSDHDYGHVSVACYLHGFSETRAVVAQHLTAFGIADLDVLP